MALCPGLVSVTLRSLGVPEIVALAAGAGLGSVEWGGDVHVPHGDLDAARAAAGATREAGLRVAAYGSYYRTGVSEGEGLAFSSVLETAGALGAPVIRVWAGPYNTEGFGPVSDPSAFDAASADLRRIGEMAADAGVVVALEYHHSTFTADAATALRFLEAVGASPAIRCLWQPNQFEDAATQDASLEAVLPYLSNVHAFAWTVDPATDGVVRHPFADHAERWRGWLSRIAEARRGEAVDVLLEFVRNDDPVQLREDAAALRAVIAEVEAEAGSE